VRRGLVLGWATVDLGGPAAGWRQAGSTGPDLPAVDPLLGARAGHAADVVGLVLLEPSTEGRLAATLARHGEGPAAIYLRTASAPADLRARGLVLSSIEAGPFGPEAVVVGRSRFGPHVIVVFESAAADTIDS
jgi:hypothetical protein